MEVIGLLVMWRVKIIQKQLKNALEEILTHKKETGEGMEEGAEMQEHQVKDNIGLILSFSIPQKSSPSFLIFVKIWFFCDQYTRTQSGVDYQPIKFPFRLNFVICERGVEIIIIIKKTRSCYTQSFFWEGPWHSWTQVNQTAWNIAFFLYWHAFGHNQDIIDISWSRENVKGE